MSGSVRMGGTESLAGTSGTGRLGGATGGYGASVGGKKGGWGGATGGKRSFKQKLQDDVAEAEKVALARAEREAMADKKKLSLELLVEGYPGAFIDYFYLTHKDGIADDEPTDEELLARGIDPDSYEEREEVEQDKLLHLKENLQAIEGGKRAGDLGSIYDGTKNLGDYFSSVVNHRKAVFFYEKCLALSSSELKDVSKEMESQLALGKAFESMGEMETAIHHLEAYDTLAAKAGTMLQKKKAAQFLILAYTVRADMLGEEADISGAIAYFFKCVDVSKRSGNAKALGDAYAKLGLAYERIGDTDKAIEFGIMLRDQRKESGDNEGEGKACQALAQTYQIIGQVDKAIENLEAFLQLSRTGEPTNLAKAHGSLGVIHVKLGNYALAVEHLEKFFSISRALYTDPELQNIARINLGVARGKLKLEGYLNVVKNDMTALLKWKGARLPLP